MKANKLRFGWSEVSLLPEGRKISLAGQFYERITDVVRDPVTVTALAIECGGDCAILCSCDLESIGSKLTESVRKILGDDFPCDKLTISAIHSHTSFDYAHRGDSYGSSLDILQKYAPADVAYKELTDEHPADVLEGEEAHTHLASCIALAAKNAYENLSCGSYAPAFGRAAVGMCRRVCYNDGHALMWGNTDSPDFYELEGGNDSGIELIFTANDQKKLTGVVACLACPAQVLEHRSVISADFWGETKKKLRERFGKDIFLLPLCAPAGDQCPRDMIRWIDPETPINDPNITREKPSHRRADPSMFDERGCERIARRISDEIIYAYEDATEYHDTAVFAHKAERFPIPIRRVSEPDREAAEAAIEKFFASRKGSINFKDNAAMHIHAGTLARYELQQSMTYDEIELHFIRLGDIAFATSPYELFLDYGNRMRAQSPAAQTFLVQLTCESKGYLPTEKAERGSHYSAYVSSGTVGHDGGELLVEKTLNELNKMFK